MSQVIQEPTRCNKCQLYGHIRSKCISDEHCTTCAKEHITSSCPNPREHCCISCGTNSDHASSDCAQCPIFTEQSASLNICLPEDMMPLFPILHQPWTFIPTPRNTVLHNQTDPNEAYSNSNNLHPLPTSHQPATQPTQSTSPTLPPPNLPQYAHTTHSHLTTNTKTGFPPLRSVTDLPPLPTTHNLMPTSQAVHLVRWCTYHHVESSWTTSNPNPNLAPTYLTQTTLPSTPTHTTRTTLIMAGNECTL